MLEHDEAVILAKALIEGRFRRSRHLPADLFGEHAWHLLLVLFIADAEGTMTTIARAAAATGITRTVAERWVRLLAERQLVSASDRHDGEVVSLTPQGLEGVEACLHDIQAMVKRAAARHR